MIMSKGSKQALLTRQESMYWNLKNSVIKPQKLWKWRAFIKTTLRKENINASL
jgi:hypothetical protein